MIYVIDKKVNKVKLTGYNLQVINDSIKQVGLTNYTILREIADMNYVSRIYKVDDSIIYNNTTFWQTSASDILSDFDNHIVLDFLDNQVTQKEFENEFYNNATRIENTKDSIASQIQYNRIIGGEFIDLFREECVVLGLKNYNTNETELMTKLGTLVPILMTGTFKTAELILSELERDDYLTDERINKYIEMLTAADAITYE